MENKLEEALWMLVLGHRKGKISLTLWCDTICAQVHCPKAESCKISGLPLDNNLYAFGLNPAQTLLKLHDQLDWSGKNEPGIR